MDDHLILSNPSQLTSYLQSNLYFIIPISVLSSFPSSPWPHELMIYVTIFILVSIWLLHWPSLLALLNHCLNYHHHHHLLATKPACNQYHPGAFYNHNLPPSLSLLHFRVPHLSHYLGKELCGSTMINMHDGNSLLMIHFCMAYKWSRPCLCMSTLVINFSLSTLLHLGKPLTLCLFPIPLIISAWVKFFPHKPATHLGQSRKRQPTPSPSIKRPWPATPLPLLSFFTSHSFLHSLPSLSYLSPTSFCSPKAPWPAMAMGSHLDEALLLPQASPHHESIPLLLLPNPRWFSLLFFFLHC